MKYLLSLLICASAWAEDLYVRPNGGSYGSEDGSSWANAFDGFSDVAWGSGAGQVGAGDTLYVGVGTYSQALVIGASGTSGSRITVRAAQDSQTGTANLNGGTTSFNGQDYVTINGEYGGSRNFVSTYSLEGQDIIAPKVLYMTAPGGWSFNGATLSEYAFNVIAVTPSGTVGLTDESATKPQAYDQTSFHNNTVYNPCNQGDGNGGDGLKPCSGMSIYSNVFISYFTNTTVTALEHQDSIQVNGNDYIKIYDNVFLGGANTAVLWTIYGGSGGHFWLFNNVFQAMDNSGLDAFTIYLNDGGVNGTDIHVDNNVFVDYANTFYGTVISLENGTDTASDGTCTMKNNIFYNCGGGSWVSIIRSDGVSKTGWTYDYNLIHAGAHGNTDSDWDPQSHPRTAEPSFVDYTELDLNNDLHLAASDTAAKDQGNALAYFSVDKDGVARPQGAGWDIGPYEYTAGGGQTNPAPRNLRVLGTLRVGTITGP